MLGDWVPDETVKDCPACGTTFTPVKRKHHCRLCGGVFCASCTSKKLAVTNPKKKERVCDKCFASAAEQDSSKGKIVIKKKKGSKMGRGSQVEGLRGSVSPVMVEQQIPEEDMPIWWYMDVEDKEQGPASKRQLLTAWQSKTLDKTCWVWNKSMKEWAQITSVDSLYAYLRTPTAPSTTSSSSPTTTTISYTTAGGMVPIAVPQLSPSPITHRESVLVIPQNMTQPILVPATTQTAMMPTTHVALEPIAISPTAQKKPWFSWAGYQGNGDQHRRLIDHGDPEAESRKELEIEQFNATRVHLIYSGVWFLSTAGLVLLLGLLGAEGWFPTFGYCTIFYNVLTFLLIWYDRCLEFRRSHIRISEGLIFLYMWWAGFIGAWLALFCFNHKYQNVIFTAKAIAATILNLFWVAIYVNSLGLDASDDDGGGSD